MQTHHKSKKEKGYGRNREPGHDEAKQTQSETKQSATHAHY